MNRVEFTQTESNVHPGVSPEVSTVLKGNNTDHPLTPSELRQLERCESVLQRGLDTLFEVGAALLTIRQEHLYRANYRTFEAYCRERWAIGRSYAWRVIGAAERIRLLPDDGKTLRPTSEFQVRPFLKLDPELFPKAWEQAVKSANGGRITPEIVRALLAEYTPEASLRSGQKPGKQRGKPAPGRVGEALVWLDQARQRVEKREIEQALAAIERVQSVLEHYF